MKKILALVLAGTMLFALPACDITAGNRAADKISMEIKEIAENNFLSAETVDLVNKKTYAAKDGVITRERALEIALESAGIERGAVRDLDVDLEKEKSGIYWNVDFETRDLEYEFVIDSVTGEIIRSKHELNH